IAQTDLNSARAVGLDHAIGITDGVGWLPLRQSQRVNAYSKGSHTGKAAAGILGPVALHPRANRIAFRDNNGIGSAVAKRFGEGGKTPGDGSLKNIQSRSIAEQPHPAATPT